MYVLQRILNWRSVAPVTATGTALGVVAASLVWSLIEALFLTSKDIAFASAWISTGFAALLGSLLLLLPVLMGNLIANAVWESVRIAPARAIRYFGVLSAAMALSYTAYFLHKAFLTLFFGRGVLAISMAFAVPVSAVVLAAASIYIWKRVGSQARVLVAITSGGRRFFFLNLGLFVAWVGSYLLLEGEVRRALEIFEFWPFAFVVISGVLAGRLLKSVRWVYLALALSTAVLLVLSVAWMMVEIPTTVMQGIERRTAGTKKIMTLYYGVRNPQVRSHDAISFSNYGTCEPGTPLSPLHYVGQAKKDSPDIIWVSVDAMRWDHTTLGGYRRKTTSKLASWARNGVVFSNAQSPASSTRQTFAAWMTGLYSSLIPELKNARGWGMAIQKGQPTLAKYLLASGYSTIVIFSTPWMAPKHSNGIEGFSIIDKEPYRYSRKAGNKYAADIQVDRIIAQLSTYSSKPRFIWTHFMEPHQPYRAGPGARKFRGKTGKYDSSLSFVDIQLDRLLDFAQSETRRKRTYVIITADHGQAFKEHGESFHGHTVYQEEIHVPLLIFGPGVKPKRVDSVVSGIDIFPTVIEMAGLRKVEGICGESLMSIGKTGDAGVQRPVFVEIIPDRKSKRYVVAFFEDDYKLIVYPQTGRSEVYNFRKDLVDMDDLSAKNPALRRRLTCSLIEYLRRHGMEYIHAAIIERANCEYEN